MKQKFLRRPWTPVIGILYLLVAVLARAGGPTDELRAAIEKVQMTLNDPQLKAAGKKGERLDKLRQVIQPKFDFTEMAKRSLGANWQRRNPEEQGEFVRVFTELLENAYVDSIASYDGEKVVFTNEKQDKEYGEVNTKIVTKKGEEFSVNYKLHQASGNWKVYDVVIENISIVNNFRSQFNRVIAKSSYEDLLRTMKEKRFDAPGKRGKA
jgi:phospholipid transport system substrate-binding protein